MINQEIGEGILMANPLFNALGGNMANMGGGGPFRMIQQFIEFANGFKGNPQEEVQKLLNSGQMTQEQYNALQGQATQFQQLISKFPGVKR